MKEFKGSPALDAGLLAAAQAVEHYEISRYGTLKTWAQKLGILQAVRLLDPTLMEEKSTDEALTELAEAAVNQEAQEAAEWCTLLLRRSKGPFTRALPRHRNVSGEIDTEDRPLTVAAHIH